MRARKRRSGKKRRSTGGRDKKKVEGQIPVSSLPGVWSDEKGCTLRVWLAGYRRGFEKNGRRDGGVEGSPLSSEPCKNPWRNWWPSLRVGEHCPVSPNQPGRGIGQNHKEVYLTISLYWNVAPKRGEIAPPLQYHRNGSTMGRIEKKEEVSSPPKVFEILSILETQNPEFRMKKESTIGIYHS